MRWKYFVGVFLLAAHSARALGPHEVAVLVNARAPESVRVAEAFARLRDVPPVNVVPLAFPEGWGEPPNSISQEQFTRHIWDPAREALVARGINDHVLAWIYSTKFPIRVQGEPPVSIQGITFARNRLPDPELVKRGRYLSPLFTGPGNATAQGHYPQSFDVSDQWMGDEMPLPSMMLGYTGNRGNSEGVVNACLLRGVRSDGTAPTGTVWFVISDDVRSRARTWQFDSTARELARLGVRARIVKAIPEGTADILGATLGIRRLEPERWRYRPGCMAEHLTSLAGVFHKHRQTRLTEWLAAGATASAGTVTEPYAAWSKFPSARFFAHYARGCTMIESFFQSIACPMQILLVGEPLAAPWRPMAEVRVGGAGLDGVWTGTVALRPSVLSEDAFGVSRFVLLVDGRVQAAGRSLRFDSARIPNGEHDVRVVAYKTGLIRHQAYATGRVRVWNEGAGDDS